MCGIVGYFGKRKAAEILVDGLRRMEYRGYDSAGIATLVDGGIDRRRAEGKLCNLLAEIEAAPLSGTIGIGHTRWATHGGVTRENAHPHMDAQGRIAVVHNGIISNYRQLRERLQNSGVVFLSDTDTEVIAHLLGEYLDKNEDDMETAFVSALGELEGTFSLAIISTKASGQIYCAKRESPLIIGLGDDANYIGSDFNAFIEFTRQAVIMDDGEFAVGLEVLEEVAADVVGGEAAAGNVEAGDVRRGDRHQPHLHFVGGLQLLLHFGHQLLARHSS